MKEKALMQAVIDFSRSDEFIYEKTFSVDEDEEGIITVRIERRNIALSDEHAASEAALNRITAYPPGTECRVCGGSGRSE